MAKGFIDRFNSFVVKGKEGECWKWTANKSKQGYGKISFMGKSMLAHRASYEFFKGSIRGLMVCHSCDNPECTNPDHLFLGTAMENMQDKIAKGRHKGAKQGSDHHLSKITEVDVAAIRHEYSTGDINQYQLAEKFGVSQSEISMIVTYKKWSHVA